MDRRDFLRVAVGLAAAGVTRRAGAQERATVVLVHRPGVATAPAEQRPAMLAEMIAAGLTRLTGLDEAAAWAQFVDPGDRVAIKVNALVGQIATTPALAAVVAERALAAAGPEAECRIYDRAERELTKAGYTLGAHERGFEVVATDSDGVGYHAPPFEAGGVTDRVTAVAARLSTALINMPVLKDHNICGVTAALKNHYGSIAGPHRLHGNRGDPYVADVNCLPPLRDAHRLVVGDALWIVFEGGPGYSPQYRHQGDSILLSADPVAHDVVAWRMIEELRAAHGLRPLARVGREPTYLVAAADPSRALGVADPERIDLHRIDL